MKPVPIFAREVTVEILENGDPLQSANHHVARLGQEIDIDAKLLEEYCFTAPNDLGYDLMSVVGAVKYADRAFTRHHSEGWGRKISVEVPVLEKGLWANREVTDLLEGCLRYLTGDDWHFSFKKRKTRPHAPGQIHAMPLTSRRHVFIPYSHGLDSYAQLQLLKYREPETEVVCIYTDSKYSEKDWKAFCRDKPKGGVKPIRVPVVVTSPPHSEPSFRSRPFLYYALTAYGALLANAEEVLIPENGQGSLGGSLVTLGGECKHRSCHPGFTKRLSILLERLTGKSVRFEHPGLFQTKAQVMTALAERDTNTNGWLLDHWSCSHDQRHSSHDGERVHCGVCGNCILRRVSVRATGFTDPTKYKFSDLSVPSLESAVLGGVDPPRDIKSFLDLAGNGVRSMQRLADLADCPDGSALWTEAAAIATGTDQETKSIHALMVGMLKQHQIEWSEFLDECGGNSWLSMIASG